MSPHAKRRNPFHQHTGKEPRSHGAVRAIHYVDRDMSPYTVWTACRAEVDVSASVTVDVEVTCLKCLQAMKVPLEGRPFIDRTFFTEDPDVAGAVRRRNTEDVNALCIAIPSSAEGGTYATLCDERRRARDVCFQPGFVKACPLCLAEWKRLGGQ